MTVARNRQMWATCRARLNAWADVFKCRRCLPVALSAGFGAILFRPVADIRLATAMLGVLLLACGCAGINSAQESQTDGRFHRTCRRPLVTGQLSRKNALWLSFASLGAGLALLGAGPVYQLLPPALGLAAFFLYNGVYTPLKPVSVLALFPGGLAGGLPPLIGWTSAGGRLDDPRAWMLLALFFLWQIPHSILIVLHYRRDYSTVLYPSLIRLLPEAALRRITLLWTLAFTVMALTLAAASHQLQPGPRWILASSAVVLSGLMSHHLFGTNRDNGYHRMLSLLNGTFFAAMTVVSLWQLMAHSANTCV